MSEEKPTVKLRTPRSISEREIAIECLLQVGRTPPHRFSLMGFYDDDADFLDNLAETLDTSPPGTPGGKAFIIKLRRVVRRMVSYGVLESCMSSTHKEYIGEPTHQMNYSLPIGKERRFKGGEFGYNGPIWEAEFMLRHAYPKEDNDE